MPAPGVGAPRVGVSRVSRVAGKVTPSSNSFDDKFHSSYKLGLVSGSRQDKGIPKGPEEGSPTVGRVRYCPMGFQIVPWRMGTRTFKS